MAREKQIDGEAGVLRRAADVPPIQPNKSCHQGLATRYHPGPLPLIPEKPINAAANNNTSHSSPQDHN
ncbi:hypothetical protein RRG08_037248 [Elysia crispata]|uniref:Uncharacterized protein n=1 Tax=Elysia crispata TaxID=231223 RepID=A0AAE1D128_9GAST|nr:hypothetical protein RRG08_037248 [Elysia crispata]